jgi:uncharacterized membrane protein YkoI
MKRTIPFVIAMIVVLMLAAIPALAENAKSLPTEAAAFSAPAISFNKAVILARDAAPGYLMISLSLEDENGVQVYQAELLSQADGSMIEITIDCTSGQILSNKPYDEITDENAQSGNDNNEASLGNGDGQDQGENEAANTQSNDTADETVDKAVLTKAVVTFSQAEAIALTNNEGAILVRIQLDDENGLPVYSLMIIDSNNHQIDIKIDAILGAILPDDNQSFEN